MKRLLFSFCFLLIISNTMIFAQTAGKSPAENSDLSFEYRKFFAAGNIADKTSVIRTAYSSRLICDELYVDALEFVIDNAVLLKNEMFMPELASACVRAATLITLDRTQLNHLLIQVFNAWDNSSVRVALAETFAVVGAENQTVIKLMNDFGLELAKNSSDTDGSLVSAVINCLLAFQKDSSFDVLFAFASNPACSEEQVALCINGINLLTDTLRSNVAKVLRNGTYSERLLALKIILENKKNSDFFRAEIAEIALSGAIIYTGDSFGTREDFIALKMDALRELRRVSWTRSGNLITLVFEAASEEYAEGNLSEKNFVEIIQAERELAALNAGEVLSAYLGALNQLTESGIPQSKTVVLAVINALGSLGDKTAFDNLLYTLYTPYDQEIVDASRDALASLKW